MARLARLCLPGTPQHIIQRGNNRQPCFASDQDHAAYVHWLTEASKKYRVAIHAWVLMTNHVHLLATPAARDGLSKMMQVLGRRYVRYFNYRQRRTGTLWEGRFKSCVVDAEDYLLVCQRYIELNPVRAGMVKHPAEYRWSSYHTNALAVESHLWTPHATWLRLGQTHQERSEAYRNLFAGHIEPDELNKVRDAVNKGLALGNDRFRDEIERLTGRRMRLLRRGPKPKNRPDGDVRKPGVFTLTPNIPNAGEFVNWMLHLQSRCCVSHQHADGTWAQLRFHHFSLLVRVLLFALLALLVGCRPSVWDNTVKTHSFTLHDVARSDIDRILEIQLHNSTHLRKQLIKILYLRNPDYWRTEGFQCAGNAVDWAFALQYREVLLRKMPSQ